MSRMGYVKWFERIDGRESAEPVELVGDASVEIRDHDDRTENYFYITVSGKPEDLDAQLDTALAERGLRRTCDINSWSDTGIYDGTPGDWAPCVGMFDIESAETPA